MKLNFYLNAALIATLHVSTSYFFVEAQTKSAMMPKISNLDSDKRLNREISLECAPIQGKGFLQSLWTKTGCEFTTIGGASEFLLVFLRFLQRMSRCGN